jgi:hypothetical protein
MRLPRSGRISLCVEGLAPGLHHHNHFQIEFVIDLLDSYYLFALGLKYTRLSNSFSFIILHVQQTFVQHFASCLISNISNSHTCRESCAVFC